MSQPTADLVQRVVEITGTACSAPEAKHLLAACDNDVEAAIALFFEGGGSGGNVHGGGNAIDIGVDLRDVNNDVDDIHAYATNINELDQALATANIPLAQVADDNVRAPIAPIREQLIGPEDDNFYSNAATAASTSSTTSTGRLATRNTRRVKVCPLRDFAREGALMEEQLQQAARGFGQLENNYERATHSRSRMTNDSMATMNIYGSSVERKRKRLEDLYRPPTDITFAGTFQAARTKAEILKKWLLVNVQSDNFDSQLLNRDVWPDKTLRKLIKRHFLLWQVDVDSSEGRRFVAFYHCTKLPYLCVIDPRTGEEMWKNITPKHSNTLPELQKFILEQKDFSFETSTAITTATVSTSPSSNSTDNGNFVDSDNEEESNNLNKYKNKNNNANDNDDVVGISTSSNSKKKRNKIKILELSEEEQIALAIRNSMRENGSANGIDNKSTSSSSSGAITALDNMELYDDMEDDDDDDEYDNMVSGTCNPSNSDCIEDKKDKQGNENRNTTTSHNAVASYEQQLGAAKGELTMLKLRLIKADGTDEIILLRWPSDTRLNVLHTYINQMYPHITARGYKLICAFPRKTLQSEYNLCSLKEIGLHPSANLHITFDD